MKEHANSYRAIDGAVSAALCCHCNSSRTRALGLGLGELCFPLSHLLLCDLGKPHIWFSWSVKWGSL